MCHPVRHSDRLSLDCDVYGDFVLEPVLEAFLTPADWEHPPTSHSPQPSPNSAKVSRSGFSLFNAMKFSASQRLQRLLCVRRNNRGAGSRFTHGASTRESVLWASKTCRSPGGTELHSPVAKPGRCDEQESLRFALLLFVADGPALLYSKCSSSVWVLLQGQFNLTHWTCQRMAQLISLQMNKS